jgi:hypothetical protein
MGKMRWYGIKSDRGQFESITMEFVWRNIGKAPKIPVGITFN